MINFTKERITWDARDKTGPYQGLPKMSTSGTNTVYTLLNAEMYVMLYYKPVSSGKHDLKFLIL